MLNVSNTAVFHSSINISCMLCMCVIYVDVFILFNYTFIMRIFTLYMVLAFRDFRVSLLL
jgi:hypothetical protein